MGQLRSTMTLLLSEFAFSGVKMGIYGHLDMDAHQKGQQSHCEQVLQTNMLQYPLETEWPSYG